MQREQHVFKRQNELRPRQCPVDALLSVEALAGLRCRRAVLRTYVRRSSASAFRTADEVYGGTVLSWGINVMTIDGYVRWLRRATLAVALIMIGWGSSVVLGQPVTGWFAASATIWMALLFISALWQLLGSFTAIAALVLATAVVSLL